MKHDPDTSENQTAEQQLLERISREYNSLKRDRPGNVLATKEALGVCHEATRFAIFLEAIGHHKFVQNYDAYKALHKDFAKYIPHLDDTTRPEGITQEAEDKFGWCPEVMTAAKGWAKYRKSIQKK